MKYVSKIGPGDKIAKECSEEKLEIVELTLIGGWCYALCKEAKSPRDMRFVRGANQAKIFAEFEENKEEVIKAVLSQSEWFYFVAKEKAAPKKKPKKANEES